ncbi:MAG: TCR/Tet family MFS transporter [Opitutaceae bacterium]|jgi:DHA1 family tetracycline resistance protein-like MFS transporter
MDAPAQRKPALGFIFVTLVLLMLGIGIVIPVLPGLITQFKGGSVAEGSESYGWLVGAFATMQFIAAPVLGSLSDRFGRRKVILLALTGSAIDYVVMGLAPTLAWLFVARMISGMTAGSLAACNAYIADVTPPAKRAQAYGLVGVAFGLGFVIGPAIGGLLGQVNLRLPFFAAAGCVGINALYGAFVLPESLTLEHRRTFSWRRANPVGSLLALRRFRGVVDLAWMYFIFNFANTMLQSVWVLYTGKRFGWTTLQVGLSLTYVGAVAIVVQGALVKRIIAWTGERKGLVLGLAISAFSMAGYGTATEGWMIYAFGTFAGLGGIAGPAAQALLTKHVPPNEQGALQGSLSGLVSLAYIFGPMIAAWSYGKCIADNAILHLPGVAFYEASVCILVSMALAFRSFQLDDRLAASA